MVRIAQAFSDQADRVDTQRNSRVHYETGRVPGGTPRTALSAKLRI